MTSLLESYKVVIDPLLSPYTEALNPLSAMVAIWRHIIASFKVFGTERVGIWIF